MNLRNVLRELLEKERISITKLAKETDVPIQTIHGWLVGKNPSNANHLRKVAQFFKVTIHYLLFGEDDPFEKTLTTAELKQIFSGDIRVTIHKLRE